MNFFKKKKTYTNPVLNVNCTELEINSWEVSQFVIDKLVPISTVHPFPLNELMLLTSAVCIVKPRYIFEWGTNIGKSARIFHEITQSFSINCEIHSVDLPDDIEHNEHPRNNRGFMVKGLNNVKLHLGDGLDTALELHKKLSKDSPVLFFVDGDHSYESVYRELKAILINVPKANVLLHDTFFQSEESNYNVGPRKAIEDVLHEVATHHKVMHIGLGLPGMSFIYN